MESGIVLYNGHSLTTKEGLMPRTTKQNGLGQSFGQRMAALRKAAGYSQRDFAAETGISQRMIAYYEAQTEYPPTHHLPKIAEVLGVTTDELLGVTPIKEKRKVLPDTRLWKRFKQVEKFPSTARRDITRLLDVFIKGQKVQDQADQSE